MINTKTNNKMTVTARKRSVAGKTVFEGYVNLPNFVSTKLRKSDGCTHYGTMSNLRQASQMVAERYFLDLNFVDTTAKVAAKKSTK